MAKKKEITIRSSAAEYLTYAASVGDQPLSVELRYEDENIWLTQKLMAELYGVTVPDINQHLKTIYDDRELIREATVKKFLIVQQEGGRMVNRQIDHYNLQTIIAVGFKVNNERAVQFRKWANNIVKEYTIKGWVMDDVRLKEGGFLTDKYFDAQLERIREIRMSERKFYQKITDIYATSMDYDPQAPATLRFYATVQNKLHYAVNRQTAAEIIYDRADSDKEFMGLTSFKGADVTLDDVRIAKNYLSEKELKKLNALVSAFFDVAEYQAENHNEMHMSDYVEQLDRTIRSVGEEVLEGAGKVSHKKAMEKAEGEYRKYQVKTLSSAEKAYIETLKELKSIENMGKKK